MTNDERDCYIRETHDTIIELKPMVQEHRKAIMGNGRKGILDRLIELEAHHLQCMKQQEQAIPKTGNFIAGCAMVIAIIAVIVGVLQ